MTSPEQQDIDLIRRTLDNLDFIEQYKERNGPWEVTQTVNSFLSIIAHPRERLLDPEAIKWLTLTDSKVTCAGLPSFASSWKYDSEQPRTLAQLLRLLRNGIAHGNVDLLDRRELETLRPDAKFNAPLNYDDVAGIEIWNADNGKNRTWGTVLTVEELGQALRGFATLALDEDLRRREQPEKKGGRKERLGRSEKSRLSDLKSSMEERVSFQKTLLEVQFDVYRLTNQITNMVLYPNGQFPPGGFVMATIELLRSPGNDEIVKNHALESVTAMFEKEDSSTSFVMFLGLDDIPELADEAEKLGFPKHATRLRRRYEELKRDVTGTVEAQNPTQ